MNNVLKSIISKTISKEFVNVSDDFRTVLDLDKKQKKEYEAASKETEALTSKVLSLLPKENSEVLEDLVNSISHSMYIEVEWAFKQGVLLALTDLNYLSEATKSMDYMSLTAEVSNS